MSIAGKLEQIAFNMQSVYDNGYYYGVAIGETNGIARGEKKERDRFWDTYQQNGTRTDYEYAFSGDGWTDELFKPKYPFLNVRSPYMMFMCARRLTYIPAIEFSPYASYGTMFRGCKSLVTIEKLKFTWTLKIVEDYNLRIGSDSFRDCLELQNLTIEGTLLRGGLDLQWSTKLSRDSIISIITALDGDVSNQTITLSLTSVDNAFDGGSTGYDWLNLIATKSNWTISLA